MGYKSTGLDLVLEVLQVFTAPGQAILSSFPLVGAEDPLIPAYETCDLVPHPWGPTTDPWGFPGVRCGALEAVLFRAEVLRPGV